MELLIVLGLCFGAYELLGVFQGCFQNNDHPLPYQRSLHSGKGNNGNNSGSQNDETKEEDDEQLSEKKDNVDSEEYQIVEKGNKLKSVIEAYNSFSRQEKNALNGLDEGEDERELCSCYSATSEFDEFENDDTKTILRTNKKLNTRKNYPINKFSLSSSLMSLNRDELTLFNYFDDGISNSTSKFSKFKSETQVFETSFNEISSNESSNNDLRNKKSTNNFLAGNTMKVEATETTTGETYNEINIKRNSSTVDSDSTRKKIFFISAAS